MKRLIGLLLIFSIVSICLAGSEENIGYVVIGLFLYCCIVVSIAFFTFPNKNKDGNRN